MRTSSKPPDYRKCLWKKGERWIDFLLSGLVTFILSWFFYKSIWAVIPLSLVGYLYWNTLVLKKKSRQKAELQKQFRDCILSVSNSLQAGYSVENAFLESEPDMLMIYGQDSYIVYELQLIRRGLRINISLEDLLSDFGERSGCGEIQEFSEVFVIAKRNGGNLPEIIHNTADMIGRKIELNQEISVVLAGKRMELTIMKGMPFLILLYVGTVTPGYFECLYHNLKGGLIMTGCLVAYILAYLAGEMVFAGLMRMSS